MQCMCLPGLKSPQALGDLPPAVQEQDGSKAWCVIVSHNAMLILIEKKRRSPGDEIKVRSLGEFEGISTAVGLRVLILLLKFVVQTSTTNGVQ